MTLGSIGMITLWVMDQLVFHRLLSSVFLVGLKIEKDDNEIPPIRFAMMKTQEGLGTHTWERLFYLGPVLVFVLISAVVIAGGSDELFSPNRKYFSLNTRLLSITLCILQLVALLWMIAKLPSMSLKTRASYFNDPEFTDLLTNNRCETVIARFHSKPSAVQVKEGHVKN